MWRRGGVDTSAARCHILLFVQDTDSCWGGQHSDFCTGYEQCRAGQHSLFLGGSPMGVSFAAVSGKLVIQIEVAPSDMTATQSPPPPRIYVWSSHAVHILHHVVLCPVCPVDCFY